MPDTDKCREEALDSRDAWDEYEELEDEIEELSSNRHEKCEVAFREDNGDWMHTTTSAAMEQFFRLMECTIAEIELEEAQAKLDSLYGNTRAKDEAFFDCLHEQGVKLLDPDTW